MLFEEEYLFATTHCLLLLFTPYPNRKLPDSQEKTVKCRVKHEPPVDPAVVSKKEQGLRRINRHRLRMSFKLGLHRLWLLLRIQSDVVNVHRS